MKHYHTGSTEKQKPGRPRPVQRLNMPAFYEAVDAVNVDGKSSQEKVAFQVGFEIAMCVARHAPELALAWYEALVRDRVAHEENHAQIYGHPVEVDRNAILSADRDTAMEFAGHCARLGLYEELFTEATA